LEATSKNEVAFYLIFVRMKKGLIALLLIILVISVALLFLPGKKPQTTAPPRKERTTPARSDIKVITGLKTCEICGYKALESKGDTCLNCNNVLSNNALQNEGVSTIQELVMIKQIEYFMPDTLGKPIDFMVPVVTDKGYPKNPNWHPKIYESQIYEIQRAMVETKKQADSVSTDEPVSQRK